MRFVDQRALLVKELAAAGITDQRVLEAISEVPREMFVTKEYQSYSYQNRALPIDLGQTISQPLMIAIMLQELELKPQDCILEIGTGSGYQTALLAGLVSEVYSVELLESLSLGAQKTLKELGIKNAWFRIGDGAAGWTGAYPPRNHFSKIIVSAGAKAIPPKLQEQLSEGGRMVIPVGESSVQTLWLLTKQDGQIISSNRGGCSFVPLVTKLIKE